MSNRFMPNTGRYYSTRYVPKQVDVAFKVLVGDSAGYGVVNVAGPGIAAVYMHTTGTPPTGSPNPAAGFIMIKFTDNYKTFIGFDYHIDSPPSGSDVVVTAAGAALVVGGMYTITTLGTTTAADWITLGLPLGLTPTVGQSFVALATGAGTGSGKVQVPKTAGSTLNHIEVCGLPGTNLYPIGTQANTIGGYVYLQCLAPTNSSTTTLIPTAPADNTIIHARFLFEDSSVTAGTAGQ